MSGAGVLSSGLPLASLLGNFMALCLMGKGIVLAQVACLIVAAAVFTGKNHELNSVIRSSKRFLREFLSGRDVLDYYLTGEKGRLTYLELIYDRTCERMVKRLDPDLRRSVIGRQGGAENAALSPREVELVRGTCDHAVAEEKMRLGHGLGVLAASASVSPVLGLLGTVWGVMDAFADMGAKEAVTSAGVVSALSSSLLPSAVGLMVAVSGAIFYYNLTARLRQLAAEMDGFADELMGRVACEFQGGND